MSNPVIQIIILIFYVQFCSSDTPSITAKLISEQKEDKEKKNYEEKEKVKAENGFQDNYSVVVASGMCWLFNVFKCLEEDGGEGA